MIKAKFFKTADLIGLNRLLTAITRNQVRIFSLHGVWGDKQDWAWKPLRQQNEVARLEPALAELKRYFEFVSMDEIVRALCEGKSSHRKLAALTFDDGYRNNFTMALPLLETMGIPATFFIATGMAEKKNTYWFDRLDFAIASNSDRDLELEVGERRFRFSGNNRDQVMDEFGKLRVHCKAYFADEREFLQEIARCAGDLEAISGAGIENIEDPDDPCAVISPDEVSQYSGHELVTFGSHTVSHCRGGLCNIDEFRDELLESKEKLEEWTGKECKYFAYPNGDYDRYVASAVQAAGFVAAVSTLPGSNRVGDDRFALKRYAIANSHSREEVLARASGLEALVRLVRWQG